MPKRISITFIFTMAIAIVALFAATEVVAEPCGSGENTADYECNDGVQGNYTVRIVKPFPQIAPCTSYPGGTSYPGENCSMYRWTIKPEDLSHFNLLVERQFQDKIVDSNGNNLDCSGDGDPSQGAGRFAQFLTWNCLLKFNSSIDAPYVLVRGEFAYSPTDWQVKQTSDFQNGDYGITQGLALPCEEKIDIITKTALSFTAEDLLGNRYLIEIEKNQAGDILHIFRTALPAGPRVEITDDGISWDQILIRYPDGYGGHIEAEPVKFIPDDTTTKTGDTSTCGYWYRGMFWDFCS